MWSPSYDIIVETLTGSEFEVTVNDRDTIGYIKSKIQKYEGIPVSQQHLLYNHKELNDSTEMKDVPLVNGSRLRLVLGMKGGPISSKRVVTISDYDNWFDMSDVLSRQDAVNLKTPGLKLLVYKDNKKNIHRLMKVRAEKTSEGVKSSVARAITANSFDKDSQRHKDNALTSEKLNQIKTKMNKLSMKKKKYAQPVNSEPANIVDGDKSTMKDPPILPLLSDNNQIANFQNSINKTIERHPDFDKRSQIRENLQRNRSFKTINAKSLDVTNDINASSSRLERSLSFHSNNILNRPDDQNVNKESKFSSASLHDIIEILKYNPSKLRTISNDAINKIVSTKKQKKNDNSSLKNIDEYIRDYDISMNNRMKAAKISTSDYNNLLTENKTIMFNKDNATCSTEISFEKGSNSSGLDKSFRSLYKSTSDDNNAYELPKLLIREDSPVESFHSSYPQLETMALRGESPKNFNNISKLDTSTEGSPINSNLAKNSNDKNKLSSGSLLQLYDHIALENKQNGSNWNHHHHHSDLGINELELKFINNGLMDKTSVFKLPTTSNLEINHWNNLSTDSVNNYANIEEEENPNHRTSSASTNFINSDLSLSSDEDDLFNISDLVYKNNTNKSKSIDLNEFRKTFGSSPTLLNNFNANYSIVPQLSRLDTIPSQYRRGYTNLNDACLSSSTSELECVNNATKKKNSNTDNSELSPLLKHRNNEHIAYVRSYENLNRYKAFSVKNSDNRQQQINCGSNDNSENITGTDCSSSGSNLIDDSFTDFEYKFSKLSCNNSNKTSNTSDMNHPHNDPSSSNYYFPSDESLFNMDSFFDDFVEIDTADIFDNSEFINVRNSNQTKIIHKNSSSNIILPEILQDEVLIKTQMNDHVDDFIDKHKTEQIKSKKLRCAQCNKKLGVIMIMRCHCEKIFCAQHRYAEAHNCSYNFKMEGKKILQRDNPQIIAQKLPKI